MRSIESVEVLLRRFIDNFRYNTIEFIASYRMYNLRYKSYSLTLNGDIVSLCNGGEPILRMKANDDKSIVPMYAMGTTAQHRDAVNTALRYLGFPHNAKLINGKVTLP